MNEELGFQYHEEAIDEIIFFDKIKHVYTRLQDDLSRRIYTNRLLFSMTGDAKFMRSVILDTKLGEKLYTDIQNMTSHNIYIYGAGMRGQRLVKLFPEIPWKGFVDKNKRGYSENLNLLPIIGCDDVFRNENISIIISIYSGYEEVREYLIGLGVKREQIIALGEYDKEMSRSMYFDTCVGQVVFAEKYFVDAGTFDGSDIEKYFNGFDNIENLRAVAFEPDRTNYLSCKERLNKYSQVLVYNAALSDKKGKFSFSGEKGEGCSLCENGTSFVNTVRLDDVLADKAVGYIKMDVEGSEIPAILGAKEIIKQQKPKLAISIYHKRMDIWKIPALLLDLCPEYRFYIRHYTVSYGDTVLYAF